MAGEDLSLLRRAYEFTASHHAHQKRLSGEPFISHPLEVVHILAGMKMDPVCLAAGMLHDVIEDTHTTPELVRQDFGAEVARIVEGVTKISRIKFLSPEEQQAENFRKMVLAMVDDIRVVLVKLADRLHNMRTLEYLPPDRRQRIARETVEIYAPIAHRLGMGKIRGELEDLAFRHLEPEAFEDLKRTIGLRARGARLRLYGGRRCLRRHRLRKIRGAASARQARARRPSSNRCRSRGWRAPSSAPWVWLPTRPSRWMATMT